MDEMIKVGEKVGIVQLKKLFGFVADLCVAVVKIIEDGKFGIGDALRIIGLMKSGVDAFKGIAAVKDEIKDLSDAEKADLLAFVESKLDIKNATLKGYVEQAIQFLIGLLDFYSAIKPKA